MPEPAMVCLTGKRVYSSKRHARLALRHAPRLEHRTRRRLCVYACCQCGLWHLGHQGKPQPRGRSRPLSHEERQGPRAPGSVASRGLP